MHESRARYVKLGMSGNFRLGLVSQMKISGDCCSRVFLQALTFLWPTNSIKVLPHWHTSISPPKLSLKNGNFIITS